VSGWRRRRYFDFHPDSSDSNTGNAVVYNARKRGEDRASDYFKRTESIAGVKDMRFQALMPDILHWLGIKKIDRMLSMSKLGFPDVINCPGHNGS